MESNSEQELSLCFQQLSTSVDKKTRRDAVNRLARVEATAVSSTLWTNLQVLVSAAKEDSVDSIRAGALQTLLNLFESSSCPEMITTANGNVVIEMINNRIATEPSEDNR